MGEETPWKVYVSKGLFYFQPFSVKRQEAVECEATTLPTSCLFFQGTLDLERHDGLRGTKQTHPNIILQRARDYPVVPYMW